MSRFSVHCVAGLMAGLLLAGCGKPPAVEAAAGGKPPADWANPGANAVQARDASTPEQALFVEKCGMCHREMGMGTVILARRQPADRAILERREDLTPELIRVAVRTGIINMPRIPRGEVSDEQLEAIIRHLVKVKP
ncbi:MAG: c-type cytochrome [Proteobacteria bacterium]|nr:c-type cytochrome [Pseudomonadota bacterium]